MGMSSLPSLHRSVTVVTDHQPLVSIFGNPKSKPPLRIERWLLKLQQYECNIVYQLGKNNPADYISRHSTSGCDISIRESKLQQYECNIVHILANEYVNFVIENAVPKAITLDELEAGTVRDEMPQQIMTCVIDGRWKAIQKSPDARLRSFYNVRDELTIASNAKLLMRGSRIVIPSLLQERAVALAHEGHQGKNKVSST